MAIVKVMGALPSKGVFKAEGDTGEGTPYDNTKVVIQVSFTKKQIALGAVGYNTEIYNFDNSIKGMAAINALGVSFPADLEVVYQPIKGGNEIISIQNPKSK